MALPDLTGQNIQDTYQRVLQTDDGTLRDGTGSLISSLTISNYTLPTTDGDANQTIITDGVGNLSFANPTAEATHIEIKNETSETITKGTPVYITGNVGGSTRLTIDVADASDPNKMPAVGLLESTLGPNEEGFIAQGGFLRQITTTPIDGTSTTSNDTVYVKAGGGLTVTKPSGSALIQNIAKVARSHQSAGSLIVSSILRTNDVPNLLEGQIFFGSGSNQIYQTHISSALDDTTLNNITISNTGSFGRVICTTISASTGEFDANTIFIGGVSFNKGDLDDLKEGKTINTVTKDLGEGDTGKANVIRPEAVMHPDDNSTYSKYTTTGRIGTFISGTLFHDFNLNGNNNYARIGDGNTDIQLKGNINDATLDGGTF